MTLRSSLSLLLALSACGGTSGSDTPRGGNTTGMVVVHSDYKSTSVSLVDPATATVTQDDCIDSGSKQPVLSMALSGDVALPSQTQSDGTLVLIDRKNAALVWLTPATCTVTKQLSVGTGFLANPQDLVPISATKAYVSRFDSNASAGKQAFDGGNDLLVIDPQAGTMTGRVDLASLATSAAVLPRPTHAILANGKVYVALNEISADFMVYGTGRVAIVDPGTDAVVGSIDLPTLSNCDGLDYVASQKKLLVSCRGDGGSATPAGTSAVLVYDVSGATPMLTKTIAASALGNRAVGGLLTAVSDTTAIVAVNGDFSGTPPDSLWSLDLVSGSASSLATASGAFVLGTAAADTTSHRVFVTDASTATPKVTIYDSSAAALKDAGAIDTASKRGLPPRLIGWY